jgi:hypothetical protein
MSNVVFQKSIDNRLSTLSSFTGGSLEPVGMPFGIANPKSQIANQDFEI